MQRYVRPSASSVPVDSPRLPRYRRVGIRMSCLPCEVAWTGPAGSTCWVCDGPGLPGPPPSIYPDID